MLFALVGLAWLLPNASAEAATFIVTNTNDAGGGSLRLAMQTANSAPGADDVLIGASGIISLQSPLPTVTQSVTIAGPGTAHLTVRNDESPDPEHDLDDRIFTFSGGTNRVSGMRITSGATYSLSGRGGAIDNSSTLTLEQVVVAGSEASVGGGIHSSGTLTVRDSTISGNKAFQGGGIAASGTTTLERVTVANNSGGGIYAYPGTMTVSRSTISGNTRGTVLVYDGGITSEGTLTVTETTISNNAGSGIHNLPTGQATVDRALISGNSGKAGLSFGAYNSWGGGGVANEGTMTVRNSTVTGNNSDPFAGADAGGILSRGPTTILNSTIAANRATAGSDAANLYGDLDTVTVKNSIVADPLGGTPNCVDGNNGTISSQGFNLESANSCGFNQSTDLDNTNPELSALADNGGQTRTMALPLWSPALDRGVAEAGMTTDQRGQTRPFDQPLLSVAGGDGSDIGAYELQRSVLTVANTNDSGAGSLRQAIIDANAAPGHDRIIVAPAVTGTINLQSKLPTLDRVRIEGPSADSLTVRRDSGGEYPVFDLATGADAQISGLTIANGLGAVGGVFVPANAKLLLFRATVTGNQANLRAGGVTNWGTTTVLESTVSGNTTSAVTGGGIENRGTLTVSTSTIAGNTAGSIGSAGGIWNDGTLTIQNSTVAANANSAGGEAANIYRDPGSATTVKSTIVGNPNGGGVNCKVAGGTMNSQGFNLESANSCGFNQSTDFLNRDPGLEPLGDNGGSTPTMQLALTSRAIDKGIAPSGVFADQRGESRPFDHPGIPAAAGGDHSDIGAFESQLSTLVVVNNNDSGPGSLRQAITDANGNPAPDVITFAPGVTGTINLHSALPTLGAGLDIAGPGAAQLTVRRDTGGDYRIFTLISGTARIAGLTIANGSEGSGGGVWNTGNLTLENVAISGNHADFGGGIVHGDGGTLTVRDSTLADNSGAAIYSGSGQVTLERVLISGNAPPASGAGGIHNQGATLKMQNSTVTGNTASPNSVGGVLVGGPTTIENSTIAANSMNGPGGSANVFVSAGGLTVKSTIVANPQAGSTSCVISGATVTSQGHNLDSANSCGFNQPTDLTNTNPQLVPLADNGGPTKTMALAGTSPALDKGKAATGMTTDQRGNPRPVDLPGIPAAAGGDGSDIGALELGSGGSVVTTTNDSGPGSLRQAIADANGDPASTDPISFAPGVTGTINLQSALPAISGSVDIAGPGADQLTVRRDAGGNYRIFTLNSGVSRISGLTVADGSASDGAGIRNSATLTLEGVVISGNTGSTGGGISNGGTLTVRDSTISGNTTSFSGGGVDNLGTLTLSNSTISGNSTTGAQDDTVGGLRNDGTATIENSTIAANTNTVSGDAANILRLDGSTTTMKSSIVANPLGGGLNCAAGAESDPLTSQGHNLDSTNSCAFNQPTDLTNTNPQLGPLADNGGPTKTMALPYTSPALDQGKAAAGMSTDQRGQPRPADQEVVDNAAGGDGSDIGAFEAALDNTAPPVQIDSGPKRHIKVTTATFEFSTGDPSAKLRCQLGSGVGFTPCTSPKVYSGLAEGTYRFSVIAIDPVGNRSEPVRRRFTVDTTPPDVQIDAGPSGQTTSLTANFEFSSSDPDARFTCFVDDPPASPCGSPKAYNFDPVIAPEGHRFVVRAIDPAGNSTSATRLWEITP